MYNTKYYSRSTGRIHERTLKVKFKRLFTYISQVGSTYSEEVNDAITNCSSILKSDSHLQKKNLLQ